MTKKLERKQVLIERLVNVAHNYRSMVGLDRDFLVNTFTELINEFEPLNEQGLELLSHIADDMFEIRKIVSNTPQLLNSNIKLGSD